MSKPKTGGPAFPQPNHIVDTDRGREEARGWMQDSGMDLRDWFAAKASEEDIQAALTQWPPSSVATKPESRAWARYYHADTMIAERERNQNDN